MTTHSLWGGRYIVDCPTQLFCICMFICVNYTNLKDTAGQSARRQVDNFNEYEDNEHDAEDDDDDDVD